ncbi:MAG: hypothetical protein HQM14_18125 [SAR324 cluster bacterium]|nr:hypothetical protein [SAR324 cluster bacterium]
MLHIGIIGGKEEQIEFLQEHHQNSKGSLFSKANSVISMLESEENDDYLLVDALFYLLPISKSTDTDKVVRATLKWVRELRNYSSICTQKNIKGCRHILVGDAAEYFNQIQKMDLDMSVRFSEEDEWQPMASIEKSFEDGELIEMPSLKAIMDSAHQEHPQEGSESIPLSNVAAMTFQKASGSSWQLKSLRMKEDGKAKPLEELTGQEIQTDQIDSFIFRQSGQGKLSLPLEAISGFRSEDGGWSIELSNVWTIRSKTLPAGSFDLRLDTAVFEDMVVDDPYVFSNHVQTALGQVQPQCENTIWKKYTEFQVFSLHERPVLIAIAPDLAEILIKQIESLGFQQITIIETPESLQQALQACNIPSPKQKKIPSGKITFPSIITTKKQQAEIKQQYPAIKCYAIPEFEVNDPKNAKKSGEWKKLKQEAEEKIQEMMDEAAGNPLQSFYIKIVRFFVLDQFEENSSDMMPQLQKMTLDFLKELPTFFQAEAENIEKLKNLKDDTQSKVEQLNQDVSRLNEIVPKQEQDIERLNGLLREKQALSDQLAEQEQKISGVLDEYNELKSGRKESIEQANKIQKQFAPTQERINRAKKEYQEMVGELKQLKQQLAAGTGDTADLEKQVAQQQKKSIQQKNYINLEITTFRKNQTRVKYYRGELEQTKDRYSELAKIVKEASPSGQTSQEVLTSMQTDEKELSRILLENEGNAKELKLIIETLESEQKKLDMLTTDLVGMELAFNKEKEESENFCKKIIAWISSPGQNKDLKEGLSELGEEADVQLQEIMELIEMTNKLMLLRKMQDDKQSLISTIMESLDMQFSFYHLSDFQEIEAPLVFVGEKMTYPAFASGLIRMFGLKITRGQMVHWSKFVKEESSFSKQIVIIDFSTQSENEELLAKARTVCFQKALQNFFIILLPDEQIFEEKWHPFRSLALCLPAKYLNTFLARPFFDWLQKIREA